MTEEVTDARIDAGARYLRETQQAGKRLTAWEETPRATKKKWLALSEGTLRSASNSPTTNGEVSEPRQTHCADPDCTGPRPHVAETAGCKWGNPRAASDDVVERIIEDLSDLKIAAPVLGFMGLGRRPRLVHEIHELANEAAAALAALSTPAKVSAVDDPETAKGDRCPVCGGTNYSYMGACSLQCLAALTNHSDLTKGKK